MNTPRAAYRFPLVGSMLLALVSVAAPAAPPYKYYVLAPEQLSADLTVMSLEPGNTISMGTIQFPLGEYARAVIPAAELLPGRIISGTARYSLGSDGNATDLLAPDFFAGTAFVIPHITGEHKYYVQATTTTANLTITLGASTDSLQITPGTAYEIDAGSDNGIAGRIDSDQPIVVVHVADVSGTARDAYPVPPASTELVGIRSQSAVIGANTNGTSVTVYTSDATSTTYALNAGDKVAIAIGSSGAQGAGAAIHITSNLPIAAVQYGDGDGDDATAFWPVSAMSRRHGIPVNAQYVAVACLQSGVAVTLFKGSSAPETQTCSASGSDPGKVYFGSATSGSNVSAGWHLTSSEPIYAIYEASAVEDEHNLSGAQQSAGPATPILAAISSPTTSNPLAISGTAAASTTVRLFVNGIHQQTTTSTGGGAYSFNAELFDGNNVVHVVAVSGSGDESNPSNVEQVVYNNTVSRTQSGSLAGNNVWTPGSPATPYVISATLTIASGGKLVLQPGTTLKFANGTSLTANGTLKIAGTAADPVTLTSNTASPTRGIWTGVLVNATAAGSEINGALIEWAVNAVNITGVAATVRDSTLRNFSARGINVNGTGANGTLIQGNLIDNLNDTATGIEVINSSTPTISGNTITNCSTAIYVNSGASPTVTGNNVITGNDYGMNVQGGNSTNPAPVVTGNQIYANDNFNYYVAAYTTAGWTLMVNATGNWWGSTDPTTIAAKVNDVTDDFANTRMPTVNYSGFLTSANGSPAAGNQLIGPLSAASTTLTGGATYDVLGVLFVPAGKSLTVPAGTTLRFHASSLVVVDGTLSVQGISGSLATFTSGRPSPARGDWRGFYIRGAGALIEYATIELAATSINFVGVSGTVRYNTIQNFSANGVYLSGAGTSSTVIQSNFINGIDDPTNVNCISLYTSSSPTITGNTLTNCHVGVHIESASSPSVSGNVINGNNYGIDIYGNNNTNPVPLITANQIYDNDNFNYNVNGYTTSGWLMKLNATGNWWGSTDPTVIAAKINDLTDDYTNTRWPTVDFTGFLDGPGGSAVPGNFLLGAFTLTSTTLTAGANYDVIGVLAVPNGKSLTIPAGTTLKFYNNSFIVVDGTATVQGTSAEPVLMTTGSPTPARGQWRGIYFRATGSGLIEYATMEWATTPVNIQGLAVTVRNNIIRNFSSHGVYVSGAAASGTLVQSNLIDNLDDTANCITTLASSSPAITGNVLRNCHIAIHIESGASPTVNGNNVLTSNNYGVNIYGNNNSNPAPVVTGNQIYDNATYNFNVNGYNTNGWTLAVNATGNWWGTTDPTAIATKINDFTDDWQNTRWPTVNFLGFLNAAGGSAVPGNYLLGPLVPTSTTLTATTYDVIGVLVVPTGKSLTVPGGATMRFHNNSFVIADGTLTVQGTSGNLATLTSGKATPARNDWRGLYIRASGSLIEYATLEWAGTTINAVGVVTTIRNNTIRNFANHGIYVSGTGATGTLIQDNLIDNLNDTGNCIKVVTGAGPTISGNTLRNCDAGVFIENTSAPVISGNVITSNNNGVETYGANTTNPNPVITGNQLYDNNSYNVIVAGHSATAYTKVITATGNWWGSTDPTVIAARIRDLTDDWDFPNWPTVDFSGFLDGPGGSPVPGNQLIGPFAATSTTLTGGATYDVLGVLFVPATKTLTVPAGTTLRFHANSFIVVDGMLNIQGTSGSPVTLTSPKATPARGDWRGLYIRASGSLIEYATLEWAGTTINAVGVVVTIRNNTIRNFANHGIYVSGTGATGTLIQNNLIDNLNDTLNCITIVTGAGPTISGNTLTNCDTGVYIENTSAPVISGNVITSNNNGVETYGANTTNPNPVITGNQLYNNNTYNVFIAGHSATAYTKVIDATGNWWGTTNPTTIATKIRDLSDDWDFPNWPTVDFRGFLDGPGGSPVPGNQLIGPFAATSTTLTSGATYDVFGVTYVPASKTLSIPSGTTLRFYPGSFLVVDGTLDVQGTASNRARFQSSSTTPANGNWHGIIVRATATSTVINYALIEWATVAIDVRTANVTISNSIIRNFSTAGIAMVSSGASSQILNNFIDNFTKVGDGISLTSASPAITGNRIYRVNRGIYMYGASTPAVSGNILTGNNVGILLDGNNSNSATAVPRPTITGNDIYDNTSAQLEVFDFGTTNPAVITATGNWWGTATPVSGTHIKFTSGTPVTAVNFSSPASGPLNGVASGSITLSEMYFSPNGDSIKDTTTVAGTLSQSSSWTIAIKTPGGTTVRTFTGSGTAISGVWDGQDGGGTPQAEGAYDCEVTIAGSPDPIVVGFCSTTIDVTPPMNIVTSPPASSTVQNSLSVPVSGTASDAFIVNYTLEYGAGATPSSWTAIQTQTTGVTNSLLGTWVVSNTSGGASIPSGPYTLRLRTSDRAGNAVTANVPITLDIIGITGVTQNLELIRPLLAQQLQVGFTLSAPATAYLRIYPEAGGSLVKEVSQVFGTSGAKTLSWDGRNTAGAYVVDEAYRFALFIDDGVRTALYDLPDVDDVGAGSGTIDGSYNATRNDFWKMNYALTAPKGRVRMQVTGCGVTGTHMPYNWVPFLPGTFLTTWDGRDQNGNLVSGTCDIYFDAPDPLSPASVIVKGNQPTITGTGASPNIEVRSNPYKATHSYDQISKITYRVDQDSYVTVKLLPPGISDPASPQAIVLENNVLQNALSGGTPANHEVEWKGYDPLDTNDILVSGEGVYTFTIQATGATSGITTLYRGALQLYQ